MALYNKITKGEALWQRTGRDKVFRCTIVYSSCSSLFGKAILGTYSEIVPIQKIGTITETPSNKINEKENEFQC